MNCFRYSAGCGPFSRCSFPSFEAYPLPFDSEIYPSRPPSRTEGGQPVNGFADPAQKGLQNPKNLDPKYFNVSFGVFLTISHFLGFDFCSDALRREDDET
jgi:hypothetical protein